jgi:hypothetical protein
MSAVLFWPADQSADTHGESSPRREDTPQHQPEDSPLLFALTTLGLLAQLGEAFCQQRSAVRAWRMALGQALTLGERTISRIIASLNRDQRDWSADYRLFSRSPWKVRALFAPVLRKVLPMAFPPQSGPEAPLWVAGDHTHLCRSGRHVAGVHTMRDPMSPAYHVNLIRGLRFFHLAIVVAPWREDAAADALDVPARAIPVGFEPSPTVKKPGKKATQAEIKDYKKALGARVGAVQARKDLEQLREDVDAAGAPARTIIATLDGGFCNKVFFKKPMRGIELLCRCRKDAVLCTKAAPEEGKRFYSQHKFTPEMLREDETHAWQQATVRTGGREHTLRYKDRPIYWQGGAGRRPLRLIIIAPTGYRLHQKGKLLYRQPAFLLTTDMQRSAAELIQGYVDHWQIEVAHRELKDGFGIEDTQVRHKQSVPRHPGFEVAVYAMLHLSALQAHGPRRTSHYLPAPKWYQGGVRPSLRDIVQLLRHQIPLCPPEVLPREAGFLSQSLAEKAAA